MKDITTITKGVIMHQVNCQDVMGSGVAKALYTKYPQVKDEFHKLAQTYDTPQKRYGMFQPVQINENLIASLYLLFYYWYHNSITRWSTLICIYNLVITHHFVNVFRGSISHTNVGRQNN